ncbi:MAG: hypothetical protein AABY14_04610 [Nanoarchaeota archaeon]
MTFKIKSGENSKDIPLERILLLAPKSLVGELIEFTDKLPFDLELDVSDDKRAIYRRVVVKMDYDVYSIKEDGSYSTTPNRHVAIYPHAEFDTVFGSPYLMREVGTSTLHVRNIKEDYKLTTHSDESSYDTISNGTTIVTVYHKPKNVY